MSSESWEDEASPESTQRPLLPRPLLPPTLAEAQFPHGDQEAPWGQVVQMQSVPQLDNDIPGDWDPSAIRTEVHIPSKSPSGFCKKKD